MKLPPIVFRQSHRFIGSPAEPAVLNVNIHPNVLQPYLLEHTLEWETAQPRVPSTRLAKKLARSAALPSTVRCTGLMTGGSKMDHSNSDYVAIWALDDHVKINMDICPELAPSIENSDNGHHEFKLSRGDVLVLYGKDSCLVWMHQAEGVVAEARFCVPKLE